MTVKRAQTSPTQEIRDTWQEVNRHVPQQHPQQTHKWILDASNLGILPGQGPCSCRVQLLSQCESLCPLLQVLTHLQGCCGAAAAQEQLLQASEELQSCFAKRHCCTQSYSSFLMDATAVASHTVLMQTLRLWQAVLRRLQGLHQISHNGHSAATLRACHVTLTCDASRPVCSTPWSIGLAPPPLPTADLCSVVVPVLQHNEVPCQQVLVLHAIQALQAEHHAGITHHSERPVATGASYMPSSALYRIDTK